MLALRQVPHRGGAAAARVRGRQTGSGHLRARPGCAGPLGHRRPGRHMQERVAVWSDRLTSGVPPLEPEKRRIGGKEGRRGRGKTEKVCNNRYAWRPGAAGLLSREALIGSVRPRGTRDPGRQCRTRSGSPMEGGVSGPQEGAGQGLRAQVRPAARASTKPRPRGRGGSPAAHAEGHWHQPPLRGQQPKAGEECPPRVPERHSAGAGRLRGDRQEETRPDPRRSRRVDRKRPAHGTRLYSRPRAPVPAQAEAAARPSAPTPERHPGGCWSGPGSRGWESLGAGPPAVADQACRGQGPRAPGQVHWRCPRSRALGRLGARRGAGGKRPRVTSPHAPEPGLGQRMRPGRWPPPGRPGCAPRAQHVRQPVQRGAQEGIPPAPARSARAVP